MPAPPDFQPFSFDFDIFPPTPESDGTTGVSQLQERARTFQQGAMTAKLIFSKLSSYARAMAEATSLPPFVHPPCSLDGRQQCQPGTPHQCLPNTLAVCSNLAQMFYVRRTGSERFVWQQIGAHLAQLRGSVSTSLLVRRILMSRLVLAEVLASTVEEVATKLYTLWQQR